MPKDYEAMKEQFKSEGMSDARAKEKAARIHNAKVNEKGSGTYVTGHGEKPKSKASNSNSDSNSGKGKDKGKSKR